MTINPAANTGTFIAIGQAAICQGRDITIFPARATGLSIAPPAMNRGLEAHTYAEPVSRCGIRGAGKHFVCRLSAFLIPLGTNLILQIGPHPRANCCFILISAKCIRKSSALRLQIPHHEIRGYATRDSIFPAFMV